MHTCVHLCAPVCTCVHLCAPVQLGVLAPETNTRKRRSDCRGYSKRSSSSLMPQVTADTVSFLSQLESGGTSSTVSQNWQTGGARHTQLSKFGGKTIRNIRKSLQRDNWTHDVRNRAVSRKTSEEEVDEDFCWMNHSESFVYWSVPPYGRSPSPDIKVPHTLS